MAKLTPALSRTLDSLRKSFVGTRTLLLLDHLTDKGYTQVAEVDKGWTMQSGGANPTILRIAESGAATDAMLRSDTVAFSIDGRVFRPDPNAIAVPVGDAVRLWTFSISPTGETFSSGDVPLLARVLADGSTPRVLADGATFRIIEG